MELITAVIQPFMLERLTRLLRKQKIGGYTVTQVNGSGQDLINSPEYMQPRVKVEIAVNPEQLDVICELIHKTVSTHQEGDGILFVTPISRVINLATGARDSLALSVEDKN
ncbi:MAG: hypothetical protein K2X27_12660 [Candidatus Obscuribacterales bacterium]|nr:hypothetical protein [Candidatus Obscuribacterales bacterium]